MNQGNPPANWYPDPKGEAELRYWDGTQWTEHTHSSQTAAQPTPAAPPPSAAPAPQAPAPAASQGTAPGQQPGYQQPAYTAPAQTAPSGGGGGNKLLLIIGAVVAVVGVGVVLFLVLGGGDDGPTEEERVNEAAEEVITTTDPSACTDLATPDFIQKLTGESGSAGIETCEQNSEAFGDGADIEKTDITGDKAEVELTVEGGDIDGETIEMTFVKQQDDWKVDELVRTKLTEGEAATTAVSNTVLNFGSSEGSKACEYFSYVGLQAEGGKAACQEKTKDFVATSYTVTDTSITGLKASVTVTEPRQNRTIEFTLSHEAGNWKIDRIEGQ